MILNSSTIKIAGPAGSGIKSAGQLFSKLLIDHGFNLVDYGEYPSLVRGGHNTYQITFSDKKVFSTHFNVDLFFSVYPGHWQQHLKEFTKNTLVFSDEDFSEVKSKSNFLNLPLKEMATQAGSLLVVNTLCLGVAAYLYNLDTKLAKDLICEAYVKYADLNLNAFNIAYNYAKENFSKFQIKINKSKKIVKMGFYDGNEAFGWGFIKGGGVFYSAYPMTPATGALHFLASKQAEFRLTVVHPEDEISSANMAAGAAFTGARSATGTSGGGFALMNEAVSFCGIAEIGMVYYLVSRPGPATGLPTWTSQGDLFHAIYSGHGEFPKVVLAPGDIDESFELSHNALDLAAELQTPVIVLSDKLIGESSASTKFFPDIEVKINKGKILNEIDSDDFKRYAFTKDGISPLSLPGTVGGEFLANSYEHDEYGFATEDADLSEKMFNKRMLKVKTALKISPKANFFGSKNAKKLIISWGSPKGAILEALKLMDNKEDFAFLQLKTLWPINPEIKNIIDAFKETIVIENNGTNQLITLLKSQFDFHPTKIINKNNGRPFFPEEIIDLLTKK
ncbi:MAG: 2-oxoacid:acceptor oxidoreductase subunit alpha [Candidatus Shapirobacteria bacterium]|nr:2-oxoacid:acceptor oxidoreductase subunit alpha [Candidatus Shapirobacteria bacterium]MDD4410800.1 2-oxoacid:acceptor oxidoreductase subunit alpha [Candidatus Shapirobacteria bacterium]